MIILLYCHLLKLCRLGPIFQGFCSLRSVWYAIPIIIVLLSLTDTMSANRANSGGVLIDPGHSSRSSGAMSCSGKPEYLYNTTLANSVVAFLSSKHILVALSHQADEELSLLDRARTAAGRDLLLSLHHDSVQPQFLSRHSKKHGTCSEKAKGFSIFVSRKNPFYKKSLQYANSLGSALVKRGLTPTLHHAEPIDGENRPLLVPDRGVYAFDDLVILKNANSPAVLLEAAVIVNPNDEALATTASYRTIITESIYEMLISVHPERPDFREGCGHFRLKWQSTLAQRGPNSVH